MRIERHEIRNGRKVLRTDLIHELFARRGVSKPKKKHEESETTRDGVKSLFELNQ